MRNRVCSAPPWPCANPPEDPDPMTRWTPESRAARVDELLSAASVLPVIAIERLEDAVPLARTLVDFPAPGEADRLRLWRRLALTDAPLAEDIDFAFLARAFELTGGEIRNAILAAAHAAAREDVAIGMGHLVRAVAQELHKIGRPLRRQSFGPHHFHLREGAA